MHKKSGCIKRLDYYNIMTLRLWHGAMPSDST
jgi:hypothetical protein